MKKLNLMIQIVKHILLKFNNSFKSIKNPNTNAIEKYYDAETVNYLSTYGKLIQAARPASDIDLINQLSDSIGFEDGMRVLDAGCGVCGPAVEFAKIKQLKIEAITISEVQVRESKKLIKDNNLTDHINVFKGDFAELDSLFAHDSFDKIYFLETLGYANDYKKVLANSVKVLKTGGSIYIKDFFEAPTLTIKNKKNQKTFIEQTRIEYHYKIHNTIDIISTLIKLGLYIEFIKSFDIKEDYTKPINFELQNNSHKVFTKAINTPFQLFEVLEIKFRKI